MLVPSLSSLLLPPTSPRPRVRSRAEGGSSPPQLLLTPFQGSPIVAAGAGRPGFILTPVPGLENQRLTSAFAQWGRAVSPPPPAAVLACSWVSAGGSVASWDTSLPACLPA